MSTIESLAADSDRKLDTLRHNLDNPINPPYQHFSTLIGWIVFLFGLLLEHLEFIHQIFTTRIDDLERRIPILKEFPDNPNPSSTTRNTQSAPPRPSKRRCAECHARGHMDTECRTKDTAVMRKRVASNQKRKKAARTTPSVSLPFPTPSFSHPAFYGYQSTPNPQALMAMATDAEELRRRRQQSNRDKRARRSAIPTT
jgi:hypothetical protein